MTTAAKVRDSIASTLERLVAFHGERPWSYADVQTAANVLTLAVDAAMSEDDVLPAGAKEGAATARGGSSTETPGVPSPGTHGTPTPEKGSLAAAAPADLDPAGEPAGEVASCRP